MDQNGKNGRMWQQDLWGNAALVVLTPKSWLQKQKQKNLMDWLRWMVCHNNPEFNPEQYFELNILTDFLISQCSQRQVKDNELLHSPIRLQVPSGLNLKFSDNFCYLFVRPLSLYYSMILIQCYYLVSKKLEASNRWLGLRWLTNNNKK